MSGVPLAILRAVAETESSLSGRPWPWAINAAGQGYYFKDYTSATRYVRSLIDSGHRNVDLGCMQINWHYHGQAFGSPEAALHPLRNALYGAGFLRDLRAELGSWAAAVGAYHSRTPHLSSAYRCRVAKRLSGTSPQDC